MLTYNSWSCYRCGHNNNPRIKPDKKMEKELRDSKKNTTHLDKLIDEGYYDDVINELFGTETTNQPRQTKNQRNYDEDHNMVSRECATCKEVKPVSEFYSYTLKRDNKQKRHYNTDCKFCFKMKNIERSKKTAAKSKPD